MGARRWARWLLATATCALLVAPAAAQNNAAFDRGYREGIQRGTDDARRGRQFEIDRNDIYRLITKMDDIMDYVEAAADRLALYEIPTMTKEVGELARCLVSSAEHVLGAVTSIRDLKRPNGILEHCIEINRLENIADTILRGALARLFREEKDPIAVIKWKEIYETLESATDRCEDVANIIEGVVLENS